MSATHYIPGDNEIETRSGRFVNTNNPQPETICLEDIAHALSHICRFGGHCSRFYSVAEHAVAVSRRVERQNTNDPDVLLGALHHDDAEAYLGDIPRPLKPLLGQAYRELTARMDRAIGVALGLNQYHGGGLDIKTADNWMLLVEARAFLPSRGAGWLENDTWIRQSMPSRIVTPGYFYGGQSPARAANLYLQRHRELTLRKEATCA